MATAKTAKEDHKASIDDLSVRVEEMQRRFQLYFQGIEKKHPREDRDLLEKELNRTRGEASRWSTGDRFRLNQIHQRFSTYNRMWQRNLQAIEDGTFRRDLERVKRKHKDDEKPSEVDGRPLASVPDPVSLPEGPAPAARRPSRPTGNGEDPLSDDRMNRLYNVFMQAKKRTGEKSALTVEALRTQLAAQIPKIKAKHNCDNVEFKVVLKDGKAMLKAVPK